MRITHWQMTPVEETVEVSAEVDGFRLWYRVPGSYAISRTGDPFLTAALLPAMARGEPLEIDSSLTVSPRLLTHVALLQEIHHCWNPALQKIPIVARTAPSEPSNAGTFSFFSGGVDGTYTVLKRAREITYVVFLYGFDFYVDANTYQAAVERNRTFVHGLGKILIPVQTNHYRFNYHHNLSRLLTQGSALASVALLLGFPRAYVSSSWAYDQLFPSGSHPLIDPLWSSEAVDLVHDGSEVHRLDKLRTILGFPPALANLRVCAEDMNANCGHCEKCVRTMITLHLLGVPGPFPPFPPLNIIRKRRVANDREKIFLLENIALARESGNHTLRKALLACLRRYELRQFLKGLDRALWGGLIRQTYRRRRIARLGPPRIQTVAQEMDRPALPLNPSAHAGGPLPRSGALATDVRRAPSGPAAAARKALTSDGDHRVHARPVTLPADPRTDWSRR